MKIEKKTPFEQWIVTQKIYEVAFKFAWLQADGKIWLSSRSPRKGLNGWLVPEGKVIKIGTWNGSLSDAGLVWSKCLVRLKKRQLDVEQESKIEAEDLKKKRKKGNQRPLFDISWEEEEVNKDETIHI